MISNLNLIKLGEDDRVLEVDICRVQNFVWLIVYLGAYHMPYDFMQCHIQTQNDSDQQLLAPKKLSQKMIKRGFFL